MFVSILPSKQYRVLPVAGPFQDVPPYCEPLRSGPIPLSRYSTVIPVSAKGLCRNYRSDTELFDMHPVLQKTRKNRSYPIL